ncbi:MAG: rubredoxin-like domain-containing protein [Candidatus Zixiibacteriota bacterium]
MQWVCSICGYVHDDDEPPDVCLVCGAPKSKFSEHYEEEDAVVDDYNDDSPDDDDYYGEYDE